MQSANPIPSTAPAADGRLTPAYYVRPEGLGPYITRLLTGCSTVFDIKATMAADLDHGGEDLRAGQGVVEDGALLQGDVIVQTGARIEAGAQVMGPVLVCAGAVVAAGALVRDHSVIGPGCRIGFGAEITRSLLAGHVFMKHPCFIGDSVIGRRVNIGSFCSTTGLRCDRGRPRSVMPTILTRLDQTDGGTPGARRHATVLSVRRRWGSCAEGWLYGPTVRAALPGEMADAACGGADPASPCPAHSGVRQPGSLRP
ncbi:LbetaH domain-containing protein [Streptomyces griseofuscus]|uniref:hypothetical protein n=1 Tax=Streptomyces griseofuscus TaxID=146922 RepID=UPI0033C687FD